MANAVSIDNKQQQNRRGGRRPDRAQAPQAEKIFEEYVISIDRVSRVVKGGRRFRFKALVAIGDKKTRVGVGVAKGMDVQSAVAKATDKAKKAMITIPVTKATIPHDVMAKVGGAKVLLKPAAPGTGVIAGGAVRSIISLTGVTNLLSKALGSNNKVNNAYAVMEALRQLVPKDEWAGAHNVGNAKPKKEKAEKVEAAEVKPEVEAKEAAEPAKKAVKKAAPKKEEA